MSEVIFNPQTLRNFADLMDEVPFPDMSGHSFEAQRWYRQGWTAAITFLRLSADEAEKDWTDVGRST